jgi:HAE1 family hydrophobic/amphiphilic exporter-1
MEVRVRVGSDMMMSRMMSNSDGSSLYVEIRGYDRQIGEELAQQAAERMKMVTGLVNVRAWVTSRRPELTASVDRSKASLLGVSVSDVAQALETTIRGTEATIYREQGDEFNVLVRLQESDRKRMFDVEQVGVPTPGGRIVPLKNLVTFDPGQAAVNISRLDQQRVLYVSADVEDRDLGSVVTDLQTELNDIPRPEGFSYNVAGDWKDQQESFQALMQGFVLALILMYMVMASQFESLRDPLLILISVPLGGVGVILMLLLSGTTFNVQSFIGSVILAGIVVNNAIVLVDYINQLRRADAGATIDSIILQAAVRRFRPILMTTLTTVLAMTPIALGWGEGGELQAPMARVVIGGLISGTLITLLAIPLVYRAANNLRGEPVPAEAPIAA